MGKPDREHSASRFQSLWDTNTQLSGNIPEIFRSRSHEAASSSQAAGTTRAVSNSNSPTRSHNTQSSIPLAPAATSLSRDDLRAVATDIKYTLTAAISDLKLDMQAVAARLEGVEEITDRHDTAIHAAQQTLVTHTAQLRDLHRNLEDLHNRG